jgi:hypothetical protein
MCFGVGVFVGVVWCGVVCGDYFIETNTFSSENQNNVLFPIKKLCCLTINANLYNVQTYHVDLD